MNAQAENQAPSLRHLLSALALVDGGAALGVIRRLGLAELLNLKIGDDVLPLELILKLAGIEQKRMIHYYMGTEHLLLAIIAHKNNPVAQALAERGIDLEFARECVLQELDPNYEQE